MILEINKRALVEEAQAVMKPNAKDVGLSIHDGGINTTGSVIGAMAIGGPILGLPYGALAYYGRRQNPYELSPSTIPDASQNQPIQPGKPQQIIIKESTDTIEEDGAWDKSMRARGQIYNNLDNVMSQNFDKNLGHYLLNPFVSGPLTHGIIKGLGSVEKGVYKILKDNDSPDISNKVTVAADVTNNPWNAEKDVARSSYNNYTDDLAQIRADHPVQSYLNPLTSGPLGTLIGHVSGGIENIKRTVASPTTASGDTLVYNQVRR